MQPKRTIPQDLLDSAAFADRFRSHVNVKDSIACWPYSGSRNQHGYGRFGVISSRWQYAHRVAWALANKTDIPAGLRVLHRCDNPPCCNPAHLFLGTQADNNRDREAKGRGNPVRGIRKSAAKLNDASVLDIRARWRRGEQQKLLAAEYEVTPFTICQVVHYRTWKHVP